MGRSLFLLLTLIAILFFVLGFFLKPHLLYWVIAFILFLLDFGFYSGRKQRIRYWFQGYRKYLKDNAGDEKKAIAYLLDDFRQSKYAINLNVAEYFYVEALIEEIIIREFNFSNYLLTHGEDKYFKLIAKLRKEIALIKKDCLD